MDIATGGVLIAILNEKDARLLDLHSGDRVVVRDHTREITCILDVAKSPKAVPRGQLGLFEEVLSKLKVKQGDKVTVRFTGKPESVGHIREKLLGKALSYQEYYEIINDITHDRLTDVEKTYFVSGCYTHGLSNREIIDLTRAMVETGGKLHFGKMVLDKHCIGGVPGNRTTMVVIPIVASCGFTIPKTSSRAITSPAGTADTMECLANVELDEKQIKAVVKKAGACMVHGGSISLAPADDKIIEVEHPLSIDAEGQLLASVMAKKYSVGSTHVLIDIPMGKSTKAKTIAQAKHLKKMFEMVGHNLGMKVKVVVSDGSHPIGFGVGPLLEARDVMAVLSNSKNAPQDLREKAIEMAGTLLELTGNVKNGAKMAREALDSGRALIKMNQIIDLQGRAGTMKLAKYSYEVHAVRSGMVISVDNEIIAKIARVAGCPDDKAAGLYLHANVGSHLTKGERFYTVYAQTEQKLALTCDVTKETTGYSIK